jgi:hypothetical protein
VPRVWKSDRLIEKSIEPVLTFSYGSTKMLPGIEEGIDFAIRKALRKFLVRKH